MLLPPENYEKSLEVIANTKTLLGKKGVCRYCGKNPSQVTFGKVAHSLPELIGNKHLFSLDECDDCNESFDRNLENNLANYLGLERTTTNIQGKKGVPKYKTSDGERIEMIGKNLILIEKHDSTLSNVDPIKQTISITVKKNTFTPIQVYKCFVKMALAIMPEPDLKNYNQCISWVRNNQTPAKFDTSALKLVRTFVPGNKPYEHVRIALFKRTGDKKKLASHTCAVCFNNFAFYFVVPFSAKDKFLNYKKMTPLAHPLPILPRMKGRPVSVDLDLTSSKPQKTEDVAYMQTAEAWQELGPNDLPEEIKKRIKELGLLLPGEKETD